MILLVPFSDDGNQECLFSFYNNRKKLQLWKTLTQVNECLWSKIDAARIWKWNAWDDTYVFHDSIWILSMFAQDCWVSIYKPGACPDIGYPFLTTHMVSVRGRTGLIDPSISFPSLRCRYFTRHWLLTFRAHILPFQLLYFLGNKFIIPPNIFSVCFHTW